MMDNQIDINEITLLDAFKKLRGLPNVINVGIGTKIKEGIDTNIPSIIVYVSKKVPASSLSIADTIPKTLAITNNELIKNYVVDVVELSTNKFTLGETSVSKKDIATQRIIAGGVRK
jgi:hypothetical protein